MPNYKYTGANRFGKRVRGEIQAANTLDLQQRLKAASIDVLTFKEIKPGFQFSRKKKLKTREIITVTAQFKQLLRAGVPLMEILDDLRQTYESDAVREVLSNIYESMEGGDSFSKALEPYENEFGKVYISLISVGERTGQLDEILSNLEDMLKWEEALSSKAKKIMVYPSIVGTVVIAVVILMMVFVVPQLLNFIQDMGGELGIATIALIATSNFIQDFWLELILAPVVIHYSLKYLQYKSEDFRVKLDQLVFKAPLVGPVIYKLKIARMTNSLAVMYRAGISFTESMKMASAVTNNAFIQNSMNQAMRLIEEGMPIHEAFKQAEVLPSMAIRMIKVGELSGNMDDSLNNVSDFYDAEAKELIERIEPAIEPVLTVVMAVVVGWVMMAVLGPVYDTISQVP